MRVSGNLGFLLDKPILERELTVHSHPQLPTGLRRVKGVSGYVALGEGGNERWTGNRQVHLLQLHSPTKEVGAAVVQGARCVSKGSKF